MGKYMSKEVTEKKSVEEKQVTYTQTGFFINIPSWIE